ncbi:MAG TPA: helix-turn-helix domain-containing protein [Pyrinomonadaceae bacterium]|nr:helix-turn-helix domain-containing protein [Pyrinomonadaceae bacterium]
MKRYIVTLTSEEQESLRAIIDKRSSKSQIVKRAFVLLSLDENRIGGRLSDEEIRERYLVGQRMIEQLRQRLVMDSFEIALNGKKRTKFKEKTFDGRVEAKLVALRCSDAPDGRQKWSLRLLAETLEEMGEVASISHESVRQILKKTN